MAHRRTHRWTVPLAIGVACATGFMPAWAAIDPPAPGAVLAPVSAQVSGPVSAQVSAPAPPSDAFDADGYRRNTYRAPVDRLPSPAKPITPDQARRLPPASTLFIDVLPAEGGHRDPATGRWSLAMAHQTIPGALWLPETGRSKPEPVLWQALLARASAFRRMQPQGPIVLFCRVDCWMSWNAARRLALTGLPRVFWLGEGIEGWHDHGGSLVDVTPEAVPDRTGRTP